MRKVKLGCSMAQYDALWAVVQSKSDKVRVDRAALEKLLTDHGNVLKLVQDETVYDEPKPAPAPKRRAREKADGDTEEGNIDELLS